MKTLTRQDFDRLVSDATVVERDRHGLKVLRTNDGSFIKLFRRKHLLTTALIWPYAQRFADNAAKLRALGIPCVDVTEVAYCPTEKRHLVRYSPLPGRTLREVANESGLNQRQLARFLADLHRNGVYFRSIHLGNIIVHPQTGALGLIDVADLTVSNRELSCRKRLRNLTHMLRYRQDVELLCREGFGFFVDEYVAKSGQAGLSMPMWQKLTEACSSR